MATDTKQLVKREDLGRYSNIYPKTYTESVRDKGSGKTLDQILVWDNFKYLAYTGNDYTTRLLIPLYLRRRGLWISYVRYNGALITEYYTSDNIDDALWGSGTNWSKYNTAEIDPAMLEEDDLQIVNNKMRFSDRRYRPADFSGKGYTILRKNIITSNNVLTNVLTQSMISNPNVRYEIRYDYDLQGNTITIPEGCILLFVGGSITNGTIIFTDTYLIGNPVILTNLDGTIANSSIYNSWFGGDDSHIQQMLNLRSDNIVVIDSSYECSIGGIIVPLNKRMEFTLRLTTPIEFNNSFLFKLEGGASIKGLDIDLQAPVGNIILFTSDNIIEDIHINYTTGVTVPVYTWCIYNVDRDSVKLFNTIRNVYIHGYNSTSTTASWFVGVYINHKNKNCTIDNINIHDITVRANTGDAGSGVIRGIMWENELSDVDGYELCSGSINNCNMNNFKSVNEAGEEVIDDADGIYIAGYGTDNMAHGVSNVIIYNCHFNNCGKRDIKLLTNGVTISYINAVHNTSSAHTWLSTWGSDYTLNNIHLDMNGLIFNGEMHSSTISGLNYKGSTGGYAVYTAGFTNNNIVGCVFEGSFDYLIRYGDKDYYNNSFSNCIINYKGELEFKAGADAIYKPANFNSCTFNVIKDPARDIKTSRLFCNDCTFMVKELKQVGSIYPVFDIRFSSDIYLNNCKFIIPSSINVKPLRLFYLGGSLNINNFIVTNALILFDSSLTDFIVFWLAAPIKKLVIDNVDSSGYLFLYHTSQSNAGDVFDIHNVTLKLGDTIRIQGSDNLTLNVSNIRNTSFPNIKEAGYVVNVIGNATKYMSTSSIYGKIMSGWYSTLNLHLDLGRGVYYVPDDPRDLMFTMDGNNVLITDLDGNPAYNIEGTLANKVVII